MLGQRLDGECPGLERSQSAGLIAQLLLAIDPEIARVARLEILLCLGQESGNHADLRGQVLLRLGIERETIVVELDLGVGDRTFARGHIAAGRPNVDIERGIARPGTEHPQVEVEPVHLGLHQLVVVLLFNGPRLGINCVEPLSAIGAGPQP